MLGNLHSFQGLGHECLFLGGGGAIIQFTIHTFFLLTMNIYAAYITFDCTADLFGKVAN